MRTLVLAVLFASVAPAAADSDDGKLTPVAIHGLLRGPIAMLSVRYEVDVAASAGTTAIDLELPNGAAATGATVTVGGVAHVLALRPTDQASAAFAAIESAPSGPHPGFAVAIRGEVPDIELSIAAPTKTHLSVVIEVAATTCFAADARYVIAPVEWMAAARNAGDVRRIDHAKVIAACKAKRFGDDTAPAIFGFADRGLAARPSGPERIGGFAGRLALSDDHFARVELALARQLADVPADLATVLVVDGSRSLSPTQRAAQVAIVASYLKLAPASKVQVVVVSRTARALLADWATAANAAPTIATQLAQLDQRNGSNLDVGLAEAATWLGRISGTRRVIVFSDDLWSQRISDLDKAKLAGALPAGTLVHAVSLGGGYGTIERDDDLPLAPLARATEGIAVGARVGDNNTIDAQILVRPLALEHIAVRAPSWELLLDPSCLSIDAGESCVWWAHGDQFSGPIAISGELWTHPVEYAFRPELSRGRDLARELIGSSLVTNPHVIAEIERAANAVNSQLSLIATWGGNDGYDGGGSIGDLHGFGFGGGSSDDWGVGSPAPASIGNETELHDQIERVVANCRAAQPGPASYVIVDVELTRNEIVEVTVQAADAIHSCIEDGVWDVVPTRIRPASYATAHFAY